MQAVIEWISNYAFSVALGVIFGLQMARMSILRKEFKALKNFSLKTLEEEVDALQVGRYDYITREEFNTRLQRAAERISILETKLEERTKK